MNNINVLRKNQLDSHLLLACGCLLFFGITTLYSLSLSNQDSYFSKQVIFLLLGGGIAYLLSKVPISLWRRYTYHYFAVVVVLLFITLLIGKTVGGAQRWIAYGGVSLQPVELFKLALLLFLARWMGTALEKKQLGYHTLLKIFLCLFLPLLFICLQPDFGSMMLILTVTLTIFFLSGLPLVSVGLSALATLALAVFMVWDSPYRLQRLTSFIDPFSDPYNNSYNQLHSLMGYNAGGIGGAGLGLSVEKYQHLPEAQNDFIIAIIAEEWGLIGFFIVCFLFLFLITRAIGIAREAESRGEFFGALFAFGLSALLSFQVLINIGGSLSILPSKGFTLPLVSYGGSSLWATIAMLTILLRLDWENRQSYSGGRYGAK